MTAASIEHQQAAVEVSGREYWNEALDAARRGEVDRARQICEAYKKQRPPFVKAHELLLARCLAEAGVDLDEAVALANDAVEHDPHNVLAPHVMALALLREGSHAEASAIFKKHRLPHDMHLLCQIALALETIMRPWPIVPGDWPEWPSQLNPPLIGPDDDVASLSEPSMKRALVKPRGSARRIAKLLPKLEVSYLEHRTADVLKQFATGVDQGLDNGQMHLLAGMACEEAGDPARARAHLARAMELEPEMLLSRTFLGRVYWRNGWDPLAEDIWRSLPVEGPDDFGRHYHLALAHAAQGRPADAMTAMAIALSEFFMETREFYIERVYWRWQQTLPGAEADGTPKV